MLSVHNPNAEEYWTQELSKPRPDLQVRVQTQKRYWTQELSNPRPDLRNRVQTQKRYWTQELLNPRPDLQDPRLHHILLDVTSGVRKEGSYPP